jgi:HEAT repeat protein
MTKVCRRMFIGVSVLALLATAPSMKAATEDQLIANLSSSDEGKVTSAMRHLKEQYRGSTKALPAMKKLLTDSRLKVRERAAGTLGVFHADVSEEDVKAICALLKEPSAGANMEGIKALRGVQGSAVARAVPEILPFLKNSNAYLMRDACRTLAVIGNKGLIPQIEPLLTNPDKKVSKDAQDAITALQSKS